MILKQKMSFDDLKPLILGLNSKVRGFENLYYF